MFMKIVNFHKQGNRNNISQNIIEYIIVIMKLSS